jgi:hypothetical protein
VSPHRLALACVLLAVLLAQGGCATPTVWMGTTHENRWLADVEGVAPAAADGSRQLVVRYGGDFVSDAYASLPIGPSGSPPAPFAYTGKFRTLLAIEGDLGPGQREAVAHHVFDPASQAAGRSARGAAGYLKFDPSRTYTYLQGIDVVVVALRPDGTIVSPPEGNFGEDVTFPDDSRIFLLPLLQPRTIAERRWATVWAVILTPPALAIDAMIIPLGVTMKLLMGGC